MALSDSFKTGLAKTLLGVKPANGGLTVDGLKKGLTRLNDTSRKDTKMYYQPAFRQTRRLQNKRKVTTLKKDDLLKCLRPHVKISPMLKAEMGLAPLTETEQKVFKLAKDKKLAYKWKAYTARLQKKPDLDNYGREIYLNDRDCNKRIEILELLVAIRDIQVRRKKNGIKALPLPRENILHDNTVLVYKNYSSEGRLVADRIIGTKKTTLQFTGTSGEKARYFTISTAQADYIEKTLRKKLHLPEITPRLVQALPTGKHLF